jgi:hypothetical protein
MSLPLSIHAANGAAEEGGLIASQLGDIAGGLLGVGEGERSREIRTTANTRMRQRTCEGHVSSPQNQFCCAEKWGAGLLVCCFIIEYINTTNILNQLKKNK